ncbi:hypothetical protein ABW19_dt0205233 [Dactylella cylindrospora]|nr:hypothetical protein ABW19_dt0205233 [Dactylella cylindrospora]
MFRPAFRRTAALASRNAIALPHRGVNHIVARRSYGSNHTVEKSSDLPWLVAAVAVTVPATIWLLRPGTAKSHHDEHHDAKDEPHNRPIAERSEAEEKPEEKEDAKKEKGSKEKENEDEKKGEKPEKKNEDKEHIKKEGSEPKDADKPQKPNPVEPEKTEAREGTPTKKSSPEGGEDKS